MDKAISLDGKRMHVTKTAGIGVVNSDTYFDFKQEGSTVTASYSGGGIETAYLVGKLIDNNFEFRYAQLQTDGNLDGGHSNCEVNVLQDGRTQIVEHFQWESREGTGTNIIEEVK